jgi:two-component system OmpR family response regulator
MAQDAMVGLDKNTNSRTVSLPSIKILLVEDSIVLAERLTESITQFPHFEITDVVDTEAQALHILKRRRIDIVLLDLQLKQGTGFGVLRALSNLHRRPLVVILTNHDLPEYHAAALELGVTEFLDKARAFNRLPEVLHEMSHSFSID